jgi:hypothetical protein
MSVKGWLTPLWATGIAALVIGAAEPARADAPALSLIGSGAPSQSVSLSAQASGALTGTVRVPVRNGTSKPVTLGAAFFPTHSSSPTTIGPRTRPLALPRPVDLPGNGTAVVTLPAVLGPTEPPSDLDGTLVLQGRSGDTTVGTPLEIALTGVIAIPTDVVFEPSEVTLQVTRAYEFFGGTTGDHQTIRLRGPGVSKLVASIGKLASADKAQPLAQVLVADDSGHETLVGLVDLHQISPTLAEVTVSTHNAVACGAEQVECGGGAPHAGAYTGSLPLTPGESGGPELKVTVHSQWWFGIPVLLVLVGAIIGGLLPLLTATARTKRKLRTTLTQSLERYQQIRPSDPATCTAWDIASLLGPEDGWYAKRYTGLPGATGVAPLWSNIESARSDQDLKDDETAVRELTTQIEAWIQAEPLTDRLARLRDNPPPDREGHYWGDTRVRQDTASLLRTVHDSPPPSAADAAAYVDRLRRQTRFHDAYARAWERRKTLSEQPVTEAQRSRDAETWKRADLDAFDAAVVAAPEPKRDRDQQAELETKLEDIAAAIEQLIAASKQGVVADEAVIPLTPPEQVAVVKKLEREKKSPDRVAAEMRVTVATVTRLQSAAEQGALPALAPGGNGGNGGGGNGGGGLVVAGGQSPGAGGSSLRLFGDVTDWILFFVITIVTAAGYMVPLYTTTWGAWQDWVAAFAAGVVGQVGIKWALLPALRSKRLPNPADAAAA